MKSLKFVCLLPVLVLAVGANLFSASEAVTISPDNLAPEVKFYSQFAAESHHLSVTVASGYKFKTGPSLGMNPDGLWTALGGGSFGLADMEDRTQVVASVIGIIVPVGPGEEPPPEYPFAVSMLTRYFKMIFIEPAEDTDYVVKGEKTPVSVSLINAVGSPASGSVEFSSSLGSFGHNNPAMVQAGVASGELTTTASAGITGKITASASNIDITDNKTARGDKESEEFTAAEVQFVSLEATGFPTQLADNFSGGKDYYVAVFMEGKAKVEPAAAANVIGASVQLVQYGAGGHHYIIRGRPIRKYIHRGQDGNINRDTSQSGAFFTVLGDDEPQLNFNAIQWDNLTSLQTLLSMNVYLQYKIDSGSWKTVGKMNWFWSGGLDSDKNPSGGVPNTTGSESTETPVNPANPWN